MLLRKYTDYETRIGLGQLFGILGLIGLIASGTLGNTSVFSLFMEPSRAFEFLQGFATGLSGALLGLTYQVLFARRQRLSICGSGIDAAKSGKSHNIARISDVENDLLTVRGNEKSL